MCMRETLTLLFTNIKGADQPAHPRSLISVFVIRYLKSKATRSDISQFSIFFCGLQHDKAFRYAPESLRNVQFKCLILAPV